MTTLNRMEHRAAVTSTEALRFAPQLEVEQPSELMRKGKAIKTPRITHFQVACVF